MIIQELCYFLHGSFTLSWFKVRNASEVGWGNCTFSIENREIT